MLFYGTTVAIAMISFRGALARWLLDSVSGTLAAAYPSKTSSCSYPPGPESWPMLGNLISLSRIFKNPDNELLKLSKKYGGIVMMWLGPWPILIINRARDAKELLDKVCY